MTKKQTPESIIATLKAQLEQRNRELEEYRSEVSKINSKLEFFIDQMGEELKLANLIHRTLVPSEIPTIPGFKFSSKFIPASLKGGDYFDIFEHEDKMKFGVLVASSSGHGMAALFLSVLLKLTSQVEAKKGLEPNEFLKRVAEEIRINILTEDTISVFYGVVDRRRLNLSYSSAGEILAFVCPKSESYNQIRPLNDPINKSSKNNFKIETISLNPQDKVVLLSQGAHTLGDKKIVSILEKGPKTGPHEIRNELTYQFKRIEGKLDRDVSIVVMEVKEKVLKLSKG